jgi:hypothetical protein
VKVAIKYISNGIDAKNQKKAKLNLCNFNILLNSNNKKPPIARTKNSKKT